jgi:hypothetical protein
MPFAAARRGGRLVQDVDVRRLWWVVVATSVASMMGAGAAWGAPPQDPDTGVRAAARKWERVFLTGTPAEIFAMEGPECRSTTRTTLPKEQLRVYRTAQQSLMRKTLGVPLDQVPVLGGRDEGRDVDARVRAGRVRAPRVEGRKLQLGRVPVAPRQVVGR